jgi:hypothetical protein
MIATASLIMSVHHDGVRGPNDGAVLLGGGGRRGDGAPESHTRGKREDQHLHVVSPK